MAQLNPVDRSKIHYKYLGWGVDCRQEEEEWRQSLKRYDGKQIRDIADNNICEIPHAEKILEYKMEKEEEDGHLGGGIGAEVPRASLNANLRLDLRLRVKRPKALNAS